MSHAISALSDPAIATRDAMIMWRKAQRRANPPTKELLSQIRERVATAESRNRAVLNFTRRNGKHEMLRKFCHIITVVAGFFFLPLQAYASSLTVLPLILVASTSTTVEQIPVENMSTAVSAPRFTLIPVASTFIPVAQHGGWGGSH